MCSTVCVQEDPDVHDAGGAAGGDGEHVQAAARARVPRQDGRPLHRRRVQGPDAVGINEWALAHSKINSLENHKSPPHGMACMWSLVPPCLLSRPEIH